MVMTADEFLPYSDPAIQPATSSDISATARWSFSALRKSASIFLIRRQRTSGRSLYFMREAVPTAPALPSIRTFKEHHGSFHAVFQYAAHHDGRGVRCDAPQEWADRAGSSRPVFPLHQVPVRIHWPASRCIR